MNSAVLRSICHFRRARPGAGIGRVRRVRRARAGQRQAAAACTVPGSCGAAAGPADRGVGQRVAGRGGGIVIRRQARAGACRRERALGSEAAGARGGWTLHAGCQLRRRDADGRRRARRRRLAVLRTVEHGTAGQAHAGFARRDRRRRQRPHPHARGRAERECDAAGRIRRAGAVAEDDAGQHPGVLRHLFLFRPRVAADGRRADGPGQCARGAARGSRPG